MLGPTPPHGFSNRNRVRHSAVGLKESVTPAVDRLISQEFLSIAVHLVLECCANRFVAGRPAGGRRLDGSRILVVDP